MVAYPPHAGIDMVAHGIMGAGEFRRIREKASPTGSDWSKNATCKPDVR